MKEVMDRIATKSPYSWSEPNSVVTWNTSATSAATRRFQVRTSPPPEPPPMQPPATRPTMSAALAPERRASLVRSESKGSSGQGFIAWLWKFALGRRGDGDVPDPAPPPVRHVEAHPRPQSAGAIREAPPPQRHEKQMWQIEQARSRRPASAPIRREVPRVAPEEEVE
ncbi:unnamed protein product, partial [Symbiodinium natans]